MAGFKNIQARSKGPLPKRKTKTALQKSGTYDPSMEPTVEEPLAPGVDPTPGGAGKWGPAIPKLMPRIPDQEQPYGYLGGGRWAPRMPDMNPNTGFYSYEEVHPAQKFPQEETVPSKSKVQARTMRAAAHNPKFAKKLGIPKAVAEEFVAADKAKGKYAKKAKRRNTIA